MMRVWAVVGIAAILLTAADADARRKRRRGRKGAVALTCSIDGAKVMVDGKAIGKTPLKQQAVASGTHTITVKKLGYLDFTEKVQIRPGKTARVFADLLPFAGVIKVTANVGKAKVAVDGKAWGKAPLEREVKLGSHTITITAPGYAPYTETISADPGNLYTIAAKLTKGSAAGGDDLELALVPVAGAGGSDDELPPGDDLALAPLAGGGDTSSDDELSLAPLPGLTGEDTSGGGGGDGLELTALTPLPGMGASGATGATSPTLGTGDPSVGAEVGPPKPWYLEWWAITGAAAVVVTGVVVTTVVLTSGGEEQQEDPWEAEWAPGDNFSNWALVRF